MQVYYSGPLWTYTAVSNATTVTWSNQYPVQSVTFAAGVTSSPQWNAANNRHVAYRQRNESVLRYFPPPREQWQNARERIETEDEQHRRQVHAVADQRVEAARARAEELLLRFLSPAQREAYESGAEGFEVIGSAGSRFLITRRPIANITVLSPEGDPVANLCVHPGGGLPSADVYLAQKLGLETDERTYVQLANVHRGVLVHYDENGRMVIPGARRHRYGIPFDGEVFRDDDEVSEDGELIEDLSDEVPGDGPVIALIPERRLA
jgi:hypothetical protein